MLDIEKLYKLYTNRRQSFLIGINDDTNSDVKNKALHATYACDLCMKTFVEMSENVHLITDHFQSELVKLSNRDNNRISSLENLFDKASSIDVSDLRNTQLQFGLAFAESAKQSIKLDHTSFHIQIEMLMKTVKFTIDTIPEIFKSDNDRFVLSALMKLFMMLAGFTFVGEFIAGINDIRDIVEARKNETRQANDYFTRLDCFIRTLYYWCIGTQMLTITIQNLGNMEGIEKKRNLSSITQILETRFSDIIRQSKVSNILN